MKILFIVLNLLAVILVFPAMGVVQRSQELQQRMMYVELDRFQVIDHAKLKEAFPEQAENDRLEIPRLLSNRGIPLAWFLGFPAILGFLLNVVLIAIFWKQDSSDYARQRSLAGT